MDIDKKLISKHESEKPFKSGDSSEKENDGRRIVCVSGVTAIIAEQKGH